MNDLLYVCSPYRGDTKRNKEYARKLTRAAINNGFVPVTVHLYLTEVTDDQNPEERSRGMAAGMKILENCKYILIGNKYGVSDGMKAEMTLAALKGKVMLYEQDGKIYLVDIVRVTRRLGDDIAKVYGFPIPRRRQAAVQER